MYASALACTCSVLPEGSPSDRAPLPRSVALRRDFVATNLTNGDFPSLNSDLPSLNDTLDEAVPAPNDDSPILELESFNTTGSQPGRLLAESDSYTGLTYILSNDTNAADSLSLTVSRCVARWNAVVGNWLFFGSSTKRLATWAMIWNDALKQRDNLGTFEAALTQGLLNNLPSYTGQVQQVASQVLCKSTTSSSTIANEAALINDELRRRLLQWPLRPHQASIIWTIQGISKSAFILSTYNMISNLGPNSTMVGTIGKSLLQLAPILGLNIFLADWFTRQFQIQNLRDGHITRLQIRREVARNGGVLNDRLRGLLIASGTLAALDDGMAAAAAQSLPESGASGSCLTQDDMDNGLLNAQFANTDQIQPYEQAEQEIQREATTGQC